ncbi:MAG: formyltransferase family protein, partial [Longimicrobiales bacterium]
EMLSVLTAAGIDMIALAGYLRLIPAAVVRGYRGRIVNIHPALLPAFGGKGMYGMRVHRAVLEAGCTITGVTVHHVDERYDEGRPIAQWPVPVVRGDTTESLAHRVLAVEHVLYPLAVEWLAKRLTGTRDTTHASGFPSAAGDAAFVLARADGDMDAEVRRALGIDEETNP